MPVGGGRDELHVVEGVEFYFFPWRVCWKAELGVRLVPLSFATAATLLAAARTASLTTPFAL